MSLKSEALAALTELPGLHYTLSTLGKRLRRCKPGSKLWHKTAASITDLENRADDLSSTIRVALWTLPDTE